MGLTKQYRRFVPSAVFGLVGSARGGVRRVPGRRDLVVAACAESVAVWNIRTGAKTAELTVVGDCEYEVTALEARCVGGDDREKVKGRKVLVAAGYQDGAVRLFDLDSGECEVTFNGHKTAVTTLAFDAAGLRLASGSKDSVLIVWDVVNESGLYRLRGHKGPVTRCRFMRDRNVLVSSSKDTLIKFWDLDIQHCFNTIPSHMTEVWDFALVKRDKYLVSGSSDSELRVFRLTFEKKEEGAVENDVSKSVEPSLKKLRLHDTDQPMRDIDGETDESNDSGLLIEKMGSILRAGQDKVSHLVVSEHDKVLACHGGDSNVELFLICDEDEVKKRCQKKARKERRKQAKKSGDDAVSSEVVEVPEPSIQEEFRRLKAFKAGGKVRAVDVDDSGLVTLLTANNLVEQYTTDFEDKSAEASAGSKISQPGHRSDVRTVAFSSDNTAILSGSHESVKFWNRSAQSCLRTIQSGYCLSSLFVPGDRQAVVGTKRGSLQIMDVASAEVIEEIEGAHEKEVWSLCLSPDGRGFVSASADKTVKFWEFELLRYEGSDERKLSAAHRRTLKLDEEALAVKLSNDGRLLAVSLLDSTIKVFFVDTLKFFLSLYGHKLPALALDMSTDSSLVITGGADKNVKIWGLDFGDCHKSIFAHDDSITAVKFIPNTHMFFTAGKDGKVKQWDGDSYERILTLDGHHGEVWSMSVSPNGKYVVTSGHDKTLRLWELSDEVLVLEDERETEREKEGEKELATGSSRPIPGDQDKEAGLPTKKTVESEKSAERLMEAIELYRSYTTELEDHRAECAATRREVPAPPLPPLMAAYQVASPEEYMAKMIESVQLSEIEQTLLVFPFDVVVHLLEIMETLLEQNRASETVCRMFFFAVEIHFGPLSSAKDLHPLIVRVRKLAEERLNALRDLIGFNLSALDFIKNRREERQAAIELEDTVLKVKEKRRRKKDKEKALQAAIISL